MLSKLTDARAISMIMRFRYSLAALLCAAIVAIAVMIVQTTRGANPTSGTITAVALLIPKSNAAVVPAWEQ